MEFSGPVAMPLTCGSGPVSVSGRVARTEVSPEGFIRMIFKPPVRVLDGAGG